MESGAGERAWEGLQVQVQRLVTGVPSGSLLADMRALVRDYQDGTSAQTLATTSAEFSAPAELAVKARLQVRGDPWAGFPAASHAVSWRGFLYTT